MMRHDMDSDYDSQIAQVEWDRQYGYDDFDLPEYYDGTTIALLKAHGLEEKGWAVSTRSNAKRTAGTCDHRRLVITLSKYLMEQRPYEDTMQTITHEIAHAIVGPRHGHDHVWARQHRALGGNGQRCFEHTDEQAPWVGECPHGKRFHRYRAPKRLEGWRCRCPRSGPVVWAKREMAFA